MYRYDVFLVLIKNTISFFCVCVSVEQRTIMLHAGGILCGLHSKVNEDQKHNIDGTCHCGGLLSCLSCLVTLAT